MAPFVWHDEFYKECYPKLYGLALRNVHNAQLAQDMVQEAFRILFEKWTTGQIQPDDHIDVWLKTVVVNCCRTEMQKMSTTQTRRFWIRSQYPAWMKNSHLSTVCRSVCRSRKRRYCNASMSTDYRTKILPSCTAFL